MWKRRRRADDDDRVAVDGSADGIHIGARVRIHRHFDHLDSEILAGFIERGVCRDGRDHFGAGDAFRVARPIAVGFHRQHDAFRATRADGAAHAGPFTAEHDRSHGHDLRLELGRAGEYIRVQGITLRVERIRAIQEFDVCLIAMIDRAGDEAILPNLFFTRVQGFHFMQDLLTVAPCGGEFCKGGVNVAVWFERRLKPRHHLVIFLIDLLADRGNLLHPLFHPRHHRRGQFPNVLHHKIFDVHTCPFV